MASGASACLRHGVPRDAGGGGFLAGIAAVRGAVGGLVLRAGCLCGVFVAVQAVS